MKKKVKAGPEYSIISVRILILIYALLSLVTVLFSRSFFENTLQDGAVPGRLNFIVFFTIPVVLMIVLGISVFSLVSDFFSRRSGSRLKARLLLYFAVIVFFTATPAIVMTSTALHEVVRFWHSVDTSSATEAANSFVADNYILHIERFENILKQNDLVRNRPRDIASVQVFRDLDGTWIETYFTGAEKFRLTSPPALEAGFPMRELPRDIGTIRYVQRRARNTLAVISYNLGEDFDKGKDALENQAARFETITACFFCRLF